MIRYPDAVTGLAGGLHTSRDLSVIDDDETPDCLNVEFDRGIVHKRHGARKVNHTVIRKTGLRFDGVSGWVFIADTADYDITAALTLELTWKPETVAGAAGEQVLICRSNSSAAAGSRLSWSISQVQSGGVERFQFRYTAGGTERALLDTSTVVAAGTRYHVAATFVDGQQNIFVTNVDTGTTGTTSRTDAGALLNLDVPILLGACGRSTIGNVDFTDATLIDDEPIAGILDEVRIWAATLASGTTPATVLSTYRNRELDTTHTNATSLRGYWTLNDRAGAAVRDSHASIRGSGTNNNGFLEPRRPQYVTGMVPDEQGYALRFDGYDDRGFVPTDNSIAAVVRTAYDAHFANTVGGGAGGIRPVWCIELAVKARSSALSQNIFRWVTDAGANNSICVITTDGAGIVTVTVSFQDAAGANDGTITLTSTTAVVVDTEMHIAVVRELDAAPTTTFRLIINGVQEDSETTAGAFTRGPDGNNTGILIARSTAIDSSDAIDVDEVRIWSNAQTADADISPRTTAEILQYFDKPLPTKEQVQAVSGTAAGTGFKLIHYWRFDENTRDYSDSPVRVATGSEANVFAHIAAMDSGQTQQDDIGGTLVILGGLSMQLLPGTHIPEWTPGILTGSVQGGLIDAVEVFSKADGTQELIIAAEGALFTADSTSLPGALTVLDSAGFQGGRPASFFSINDRLYLTNGLSPPLVYDDSAIRRWGIQGPTRQPVFTRSTGTGVAGDVQYRYTYVSRESGVESDPSPPSAIYRDSAASLPALSLFHSPDPQVDTIRIYRTRHGDSSGGPRVGSTGFFFVDEVTNTPGLTTPTSYSDSVGDASLGLPLDLVADPVTGETFIQHAPPPWCQYAAVFNGRVFLAHDPRDEESRSRLFFSRSLEPEEFQVDEFIEIDSGEGEPITGLAVLFDRLIIFKRTATYVLSGTGPENFLLQIISSGVGCISHFSCIVIDGWLYFLSDRGPYRFNGTGFEFIGEKIQETFDDFGRVSIDTSYAGHNRDRRQVWFAMRSSSTASAADRVLVFQYDSKEWTLFGTPMRPQVLEANVDEAGTNRIFWGDDFGNVWRGDVSNSHNECDLGMVGTTSGAITGTGLDGGLVTLTVTGAHSTSGDNWAGCRIELDDVSGGVSVEARILRNTQTLVVLDKTIAQLGFTPVSGDTYRIGAIDAYIVSKAFDLSGNRPSLLKRIEEVELELLVQVDSNAPGTTVTLRVGSGIDYATIGDFQSRAITGLTAAVDKRTWERFNVPARPRRFQVRIENDRVHENFEVLSLTMRAREEGRL